jgi:U32 family peptidase
MYCNGRSEAGLKLMAPAGSAAALAAALRSGADAVYFGLDALNMRAGAGGGFHIGDLPRIARICRRCALQSCLTLNTIVYDEDIAELERICSAASAAGIDAVIASDIAAIQVARAHGLAVHISVQANVSNIRALEFFAQWADVIVLARELRVEQIAAIARGIAAHGICGPSGELVQIEVFAHGALCVAVSGKCYMSLGLYDRSANRGECLQACRRRYRISDVDTGEELDLDGRFVMSPRDICTIRHLDRLAAAGARIFKIEGRARPADYVATVTREYRAALDALARGDYADFDFDAAEERLRRVFNRGFWDGGYYLGARLGEWAESAHSQASRVREQIGVVGNYFRRAGVIEFELWQKELEEGSELLVEGPTTGALEFRADEVRVDGRPVPQASRGDRVTLRVPAKVRRNDKVFQLQPRGRD